MPRKPRTVAAVMLGALLVGCSVIPMAHAEVPAEVGMVFDSTGRPYMAWSRNEDGKGRAYFAFLLSARWMEPIAVSDFTVVSFPDPAAPVVVHGIPGGAATKDISPVPTKETINEDINPFENVVVGEPEGSDPSVEP